MFREGLKAARLQLTAKRGHYVTPDELGKDVGVSGQTIRNYESGESEPTFEMVEKLAAVTGVRLGWPPFATAASQIGVPLEDELAYPPPKVDRPTKGRRRKGNG